MKLLLILLFIISNTNFAQTAELTTIDSSANFDQTQNIQTKKVKKVAKDNMDLHYDPHSLGISYRIGSSAITSHNLLNNKVNMRMFGTHSINLDIYTQKRIGKTKYSPLVALRFNFPFSIKKDYLFGEITWGFLFGGSQYVFDKRNTETGIGWSMLANGGFLMEFQTPAAVNSSKEILHHPIIFGAELDFKAIYNFHKYVGVTFGFVTSYSFSPDINSDTKQVAVNHGFTWGFNMGFIF